MQSYSDAVTYYLRLPRRVWTVLSAEASRLRAILQGTWLAMSDAASQQSAKPGTSCLGCRRRKLKCSREQEGCNHCTRADLPCVYPAPETGIKRKRGPYKKDKAPRERHLEDLVKYLEPGNTHGSSDVDVQSAEGQYTLATAGQAAAPSVIDFSTAADASASTNRQGANPEDLVKDALIALTKSSVSERESINESEPHPAQALPRTRTICQTPGNRHPPIRQAWEYWHLFVTRVDPLTKVVHCPTLAKKLFAMIDNIESVDAPTDALLFGVYYAAASTCTANEARMRLGESRDSLLQRYGRLIEAAVADNYGMPTLESMQALVLYIICVRRQDDDTNVRARFGLAVRMAQLMGLQEDPGATYKPYEAELRRRLWWHICGLESRGGEEGAARTTSIMQNSNVQFPANLNDYDLNPSATQVSVSRAGVTDTTFVRLRWEILRSAYCIWMLKQRKSEGEQQPSFEDVRAQQHQFLERTQDRLSAEYVQHLDTSRPYDWMCLQGLEGMLVKTRLVIDHPFGQVPTKTMSSQDRLSLLQSSVIIISATHLLATDGRTDDWRWFFRGYVQWHSLAIVVAELGHSANRQFTQSAWAVLDPILVDWNKLYQARRGEPAWDHVNTLIERAKHMRHHAKPGNGPPRNQQPPDMANTIPIAQSAPTTATPTTMKQYTRDHSLLNDTLENIPRAASAITPQRVSISYTLDESSSFQPAVFSCAPTRMEFDTDFGMFEGLDQIDFGAFDSVFGGSAWEFPSPMANFDGGVT